MASEPIRSTSVVAAPKDYSIPNAQQIRLLSVTASFTDNGAGGDWLPAVVILDNNGNALVRAVDQAVKVTAGDDAEVSWFPGVKPAPPAGVTGIASGLFWGSTGTGQVIPSGVVTPLTFDVVTSAPGGSPPIGFSGSPSGSFTVKAHRVYVALTVVFPAAAYDRYIEIAQVGASPGEPLFTPARIRSQVTPDGDSLSVDTVVIGSVFTPQPLQLNVFQASGIDRRVQRFVQMYTWPIPLPGLVWS